MEDNPIWIVVFFAALITSIVLRIRRQGRQRIFIPDYQCGLRYVDGVFTDTVGAGVYPPNDSRKQITVVDMRPRLIVIERIFYQDALQSPSVISIGAKLSVCDAYLASAKLKDYTNDSLVVVRDTMRMTVSKIIGGYSSGTRSTTAAAIQKAADAELRKVGMTISDVEITEAWSRAVEPRISSRAN